MSLFTDMKRKRTAAKFGMKPIDHSILEGIVEYTEQLELPAPSGRVCVQLMEELEKGTCGVPYYLLLFTDGTEEGYLNAGYASGLAASFLRFQGITASILRESPRRTLRAEYRGMQCTAALAFGYEKKDTERDRAGADDDQPCILREQRDHWAEEVLSFALDHFSGAMGSVRLIRQDKWIHFMRKTSSRKNAASAMFDAGAAVAAVMSSAEELWIDLKLVNARELLKEEENNPFLAPEYLISVCKRSEYRTATARLMSGGQIRNAERRSVRGHLWKYA